MTDTGSPGPKTWKAETGRRIKQARERAGLTQDTLASRLGLTDAAVSAWEVGTVRPTAQQLADTANVLGVLASDLVPEEKRNVCSRCGVDGEPYLRGIWEGWRRCLERMQGNSQIGNSLQTLISMALAKTGLSKEIRKQVYDEVKKIPIPEIFYAREKAEPEIEPFVCFAQHRRGEAHQFAKTTWEVVRAIRDEAKLGKRPISEIGKAHGMKASHTRGIISNKAWYDPNYTPPQPKAWGTPRKLDWEKVRWVRKHYAEHRNPGTWYAGVLGVNKSMIYKILWNQDWHDASYKPPMRRRSAASSAPRKTESPRDSSSPSEAKP